MTEWDEPPKWTPMIPQSSPFENRAQEIRYQDAVARGRRPGETLEEWMVRINLEAMPCGLVVRDPGQEG